MRRKFHHDVFAAALLVIHRMSRVWEKIRAIHWARGYKTGKRMKT